MPLPQDKPDTLRYLKLRSSIQRLRFGNGLLPPTRCATSFHIPEKALSQPDYYQTSKILNNSSLWQEAEREPPPTRTCPPQQKDRISWFETSRILLEDWAPPHTPSTMRVPPTLSQLNLDLRAFDELPASNPLDELQEEMHQLCLASMKPANHRSLCEDEHLTMMSDRETIPLVVNRLLPELGHLSNEFALPGLGLGLELGHWRDRRHSMPDVLSGKLSGGKRETNADYGMLSVGERDINASDKRLRERSPYHDNSELNNSQESDGTTPALQASTRSIFKNAASAETAETTDHLPATQSASTLSTAVTTHPPEASVSPTAPDRGSQKPTGSPFSHLSRHLPPPPSNPASTALSTRGGGLGTDPRQVQEVSASFSNLDHPLHPAADLPPEASPMPVSVNQQPTLSQAAWPTAPIPSATNTKSDIMATPYQPPNGWSRSRPSLVIPLTVARGSLSPRSDCESEPSDLLEKAEYGTPMTSPGSSPLETRPLLWRRDSFLGYMVQIDGVGEGESDLLNDCYEEQCTEETEKSGDLEIIEVRAGLNAEPNEEAKDGHIAPRGEGGYTNLSLPPPKLEFESLPDSDEDDITPLIPASPAKGTTGFPFPHQDDPPRARSSITRFRHRSSLLQQCENNATPRQRNIMGGGVNTPDRFIPSRASTPRKESLLLPQPAKKVTPTGKTIISPGLLEDPFGPLPRRSLRMTEHQATIQSPAPLTRPVGLLATRVHDAAASPSPMPRAASRGTVWTVGGAVVTEGVASTTNGRGGRVTSGSNAPHYSADFLRKSSPSDEEITHGRRLAIAMEIQPGARMMEQSLVEREVDGRKRVWRDGAWSVEGAVVATKVKTKKEKDVPIIPFRVLDAPALRDDYYCSLLAYSPTVECLAVGLGAHVYLWSESRGKTNIPDSLTAPLGSSHVTSVSFSSVEGGSAILAIGRANGRITLWSPLDRDPRFDSEQPAPVSCVSFRPTTIRRTSLRDPVASVATEELLVGDENGAVYYYSIEWPNQDQRDLFDWHGSMTLLARISCHSQQICGIAWSPDGDFFATGGNDNQLFLFEGRKLFRTSSSRRARSSSTSPVHVRSGSGSGSSSTSAPAPIPVQGPVLSITPGQETHVFKLNAAVKAIAFAPWQPSLLAAGSGSNDRCIHFLHTLSGAALATIDCHAQVTSLIWSSRRKEIAATFGFAQPEHAFRVAVFSWPSCGMVVGIPWWGEERALFAVPYPRGPSGAFQRKKGRRSGGGDEAGRVDAEGGAWYGKRTREEGCIVVATSDASIKFHEIWSERREGGKKSSVSGTLGGSQILEGECSPEMERAGAIR